MTASAKACQISCSARCRSPAPSARAMAEATAPPMAPADRVWVSINSGNTNAIAARERLPS